LTERRTITIASRAINVLLATSGQNDILRTYFISGRDGVDFNLTFIPSTFNHPHKEEFDTEYMRALYAVGYEQGVKGVPWRKVPPGFAGP
jgi:hypothetical protein